MNNSIQKKKLFFWTCINLKKVCFFFIKIPTQGITNNERRTAFGS